MTTTDLHADLVFEGGGVKGIGLAGALATLEEREYGPQNIAGTSAGAITAALLAAGYSASELREIIISLDYRQFQDRAWEDKVPLIERSLSMLLDLGFYEGDRFLAWIRERLEAKGIRTFADLVQEEFADDPRYRSRLQVIASDVTTHELLVLPRDATKLGIEPDDARCGARGADEHEHPGLLRARPLPEPEDRPDARDRRRRHALELSRSGSSTAPTTRRRSGRRSASSSSSRSRRSPIGARLPKPRMTGKGPGAVIDYVKSLAQTMMEAHDRLYVEQSNYARTIPIPTLGVGTTEFDLSKERALALYDSGRWAAEKFLDKWDFDAYIAEFRSGKEHSRREALVASMS